MGSMYVGWVTPTEAAAVGCALGLVIAAIWGDLTWRNLLAAFRDTTIIVGSILFIVYAALVFSYAISMYTHDNRDYLPGPTWTGMFFTYDNNPANGSIAYYLSSYLSLPRPSSITITAADGRMVQATTSVSVG